MRYYIYVSDAKVDMLLPQVTDTEKATIAAEFKVDIKLISASLKSERVTHDNRIYRLAAV